MSIPTLSIPTLPTGTTDPGSTDTAGSPSLSITGVIPTVTSTNAAPTSSGSGAISGSLLPSTSTLISSPSSLASINQTSTTTSPSTTPLPSTLQPPLQFNSASTSPTQTSSITSTDSQSSTLTSALPTTLVNSQSNDSVSHRTAVIAGTTTGLIALLLIILGGVFVYRRHKLRKNQEFSERRKEGRSLLDGEEFDDERNMPSMPSYYHTLSSHHTAASSTPSLLKSRTSENGSIFREEVWPPPGFVDPISKQSSQVNLGGIVEDVMGPSSSSYKPGHDSPSTFTASHRGPSGSHERRQFTDASTASTLSSGSASSFAAENLSSDPFRSYIGPSMPTSSLPAEASSTVSYPTLTPASSIPSIPPPLPPRAQSRSPNTQPRNSSPLARASTGEAKLWLTRSVHRPESSAPS